MTYYIQFLIKSYTGSLMALSLQSFLNARHMDNNAFDAEYDEELNTIKITVTDRFKLKILNKHD